MPNMRWCKCDDWRSFVAKQDIEPASDFTHAGCPATRVLSQRDGRCHRSEVQRIRGRDHQASLIRSRHATHAKARRKRRAFSCAHQKSALEGASCMSSMLRPAKASLTRALTGGGPSFLLKVMIAVLGGDELGRFEPLGVDRPEYGFPHHVLDGRISLFEY